MPVWTVGGPPRGGMNYMEKNPELEARGQSASLREVGERPSPSGFLLLLRQEPSSVLPCLRGIFL